jgi:hypothetical protein
MPPQSKVRAHSVNAYLADSNPSRIHDSMESIFVVNSAYVHASAATTMDMYGGNPPRFHVSGLPDGSLKVSYAKYAGNTFFRGILAARKVAKSYGAAELDNSLKKFQEMFVTAMTRLGEDLFPRNHSTSET